MIPNKDETCIPDGLECFAVPLHESQADAHRNLFANAC